LFLAKKEREEKRIENERNGLVREDKRRRKKKMKPYLF
jgi:hypothetical protein